MNLSIRILFIIFFLASSLQLSWAGTPVKKSKTSICHTPDSPSYSRTKNFITFDSLESCISSGGRLPKGYSAKAIKNEVEQTQYSRSQFGHGWTDEDKDCQNTRQEILISLSTNEVRFANDEDCRVVSGRWVSMYSGEILTDASDVDIDHIVPLKWAWEHGAQDWNKSKRIEFANDPINLVPVEASLNRAKGAKGVKEWLPPKNQVQYKARFKRIALKYKLTY